MAIGPAMVLAGLGALALATMGKGKAAAESSQPLPNGGLPPGGLSDGKGGIAPGVKTNVKAIGPLPIVLPEALADMLAKSLRDLTVNDDGTISGPVTAEAVQRATTVAAQIDAAGFPDAAAAFRVWIQRASSKVPTAPLDKQVQLPGVDPAIVTQVNRAIQLERDPAKLQAILDAVKTLPQSTQRDLLIEMLANTIRQVQATMVMSDVLSKTDQVLKSTTPPTAATAPVPIVNVPAEVITAAPPRPAPAVPAPQPQPQAAPAAEMPDTPEVRRAVNTANMLRNKIVDNGGDMKKAKGKEDKNLVIAFQKAEGLGTDGKAGPGFMLKLAKYTGDLPYVYYWPVSATAKNVLAYRDTLRLMADAHEQAGRPIIAAKLRANAAKERGQGGIVGSPPA